MLFENREQSRAMLDDDIYGCDLMLFENREQY